MGKPDSERGGSTSTIESGARRRHSAQIPASMPACVSRMLDLAARAGPDAPPRQILEQLLDILVSVERDAAAGLHLPGLDLTIRRNATELSSLLESEPEGGRLFPELAAEVSVPLPRSGQPRLEGARLAIAAPSFEAASKESYRLLASQAAAVVALALRGLEVEDRDSPQSGRAVARVDRQSTQLHKLAALGQHASEIVHELSNPLTSILAYSDYLIQRLRQQGIGESDLDRLLRIHEAATRIQRFTRDLSHYAQPHSPLETPVNLHSVIDRALRFCVHGLRSADISVERDYGELRGILGVETALTQVFVNLITNAWHAMIDEGGVLRIATEARSDGMMVEVADDGHGIPEDVIGRVFDRYFTTKDQEEGSGLGLSIVRQIVVEHGGRIEVRNRDPRGAVFSLYFPYPE